MDNRHIYRDESKWDNVQMRIDPDLKRDIMIWCRQKGLTLSCYLRLVCSKTLDNERIMHDDQQLRSIDNAIGDVSRYLPQKNNYKKY